MLVMCWRMYRTARTYHVLRMTMSMSRRVPNKQRFPRSGCHPYLTLIPTRVDSNFAQIKRTSLLPLTIHPQWVHFRPSSPSSSSSRRGNTHLGPSLLHPPPSNGHPLHPLSPSHHNKLLQRRSKAKNCFNSNELVIPNPFDFCSSYSPGDKIGAKYSTVTLSKSRMHLGSGARIQRVLNKALAGQSVTISVLGGSGNPFSLSFFPYTPQTQHTKDPLQCQHATVQGTTLYPLHAIHRASSSGGTPSFHTQLRK